MPEEPTISQASNRCDVVDEDKSSTPASLTELVRNRPHDDVSEQFNKTVRYAKDPANYVRGAIGSEAFEKRRELLCLPNTVDRDTYGDGEHKSGFQKHIAKLLGKSHGLFFITGIQAQLSALKIHCQRAGNNRVAWHVTSHLESAEENAYRHLWGLERILLGSNSTANPTVAEIQQVLSLPAHERPAAIQIEIPNRTLGCTTYTFQELDQISSSCRDAGVKLHCDGARLWEIEPFYQQTACKTFADIGPLFDSVYVSFYKGLRGVAGAILAVDDETFIAEAKVWQRRAGGTAITLAYEILDCERGFNCNIGTFAAKWQKMREVVDAVTSAVDSFKTTDGEQILQFMPAKATCCQIRMVFQGHTKSQLEAARDRVQERRQIRTFERIRPLSSSDEDGKEAKTENGDMANETEEQANSHFIEWMISIMNAHIETKVFVEGWVALCEELIATQA